MRQADRILSHLSQLQKTYSADKSKGARDLLLQTALQGGCDKLEAVRGFTEDPNVLKVFSSEISRLLEGHVSRPRYNVCLGLFAGRLMLW